MPLTTPKIEVLSGCSTNAVQPFNLTECKAHQLYDIGKSQIVDYVASNGACTINDIREDDRTQAAQMIAAFGNKQKADDALLSLFNFVVLRKTA